MIKQGLQIELVPTAGTTGLYHLVVYSHGYENDKVVITRHLMVVPLHEELAIDEAGDFTAWVTRVVDIAANNICRVAEYTDLSSLSAAYAQAEEAEDRASHRM